MAPVLLSACGDSPQPTATALPVDTLTASPVPATPTPGRDDASAERDFDIDQGTLWQELFDAFTAAEQSCIRTELGDELLESALGQHVMPEGDTQQWEATIFGCLAQEAAAAIFLSILLASMEGLSEGETCLRELLADADVAGIIAATLPNAGPDSATTLRGFTSGLLSCAPEQMLSGNADPSAGPPQADELLRWRYRTGGWVVNAPTVANGVVYAGSDDNHIYALDAEAGGLNWRFETGGVIRSTPTVTGGVVYVGSNDNHVYALDAETGVLLWSHDTGGWAQYSPTVSGGKVYLGAVADGAHGIHALDAVSGDTLWVAEIPYPLNPEFAPTVAGDKVYVPGEFGEFHALDASTGEPAWSFTASIRFQSPPTVTEGIVHLTAVNTAYALDESTGTLIWSYGTERLPARDVPAVVADGVHYFSPDQYLYALDAATGEVIWSYEADQLINSTPVAAGGIAYVSSESGRFYALDAATGGLLWSRETADWSLASPAVVHGVLYAESSDGRLRALNAATGEELWRFQKGYFDGVPSYTVAGGVVYVGALDGGVYAFAAPAAAPAAAPNEENVLTMLYWQAPSLPGPYLSSGTKDSDAGAVTLEPLAKYNPDGDLVPALAAQIPTVGNGGVSVDLTSITWRLKDGLKWSDGSDMTAHDVVFTWRYCVDEDTGCTASSAFAGIASVEALDDLTVRVAFDAPMPYPYSAFVGSGTPIISQAQFANCVGVAATGCDAQNVAPLGTGPYRIVSFETNKEAVYERNPFYRGETPYFDRVVLKGGGDAVSAARAVLETGEADYAWNLQIEPETLAEMEAAGLGQVVSAFSSQVERIVLNQTNPDPALGDNRSEYLDGQNPHPFLTFTPIPQAMSMAIDRSLISEQLYGFAGEPTCNLVTGPPDYASTANDGCLSQDIEGANRLLDDNGVLDTDADGIREHNGVPLRITYQTSANSIRQDTQALIRDWWRQIGIETELAQHDASVFFGGDPVANKDASFRRFFADIQMYADSPGIDPQSYLSDRLCTQVQTRDNNWAGGNNSRSCNPEYDNLFAQLVQTQIAPERATLIKQLNDVLVQNYYEIPLVNRGIVSGRLNTLQNVRINGWDTELWNIAEWRR